MLARQLVALQRAIPELQKYYTKLSTLSPHLNPTCPHPTQFTDLDREEKGFTYVRPIKDLLYLCSVSSEDRVCVKFVYGSYSVETHKICFELGFAPRLRAVEKIPGGWVMVVMDYLDENYSTLFDHVTFAGDVGKNGNTTLREEIMRQISNLHERGSVHGDIRTANIMVNKDSFKTGHFMLIDFDWAGVAGVARYPGSLNKKGVIRPEDVRPGDLIKKKHDMDMIDLMFH